VTLKKLESEAQFIDQQTKAERKKAQAEQDSEQVKVETDISAEVTAATRKEMAEWLARNRLHRHAEVITTVAGL